jgi:lipoprotein-anchoring transpeptidase ErfK/SrfK
MRSALKWVFSAILFGSLFSQAQVWEQTTDGITPPPEFQIHPFSETEVKTQSWMKEFTNIIVINKANEGSDRQTLRLYVNGKLTILTKISSGREHYEKGCNPGQDPKRDHCSNRPYWSTSPVGYFDVDKLDEHYFSNLWQTWMPYSVFFEPGIATHQAPAGTEGNLGARASGGCIRMHPNMAPVLFNAVKNAGMGLVPVLKRDGTQKTTAQGDAIRTQGYKTLVILQNVIK